jgi:hypothetical protein
MPVPPEPPPTDPFPPTPEPPLPPPGAGDIQRVIGAGRKEHPRESSDQESAIASRKRRMRLHRVPADFDRTASASWPGDPVPFDTDEVNSTCALSVGAQNPRRISPAGERSLLPVLGLGFFGWGVFQVFGLVTQLIGRFEEFMRPHLEGGALFEEMSDLA